MKITEKRKKILGYINGKEQCPLVFKRPFLRDGPFILPNNDGSLADLVMDILTKCMEYASYNSAHEFVETTPSRLRSSFDIWRHVIAVRPEVTIFEVMETLYKLRDWLYGHYCGTVQRTVFKPRSQTIDWPGRILPFMQQGFMSREYGISFLAWKKLHYKEEEK